MQRVFLVHLATMILLTASALADGQNAVLFAPKPEPLIVPEVRIPPEAVASGLGGKVDVLVRIDKTGKVIGILGISGPRVYLPQRHAGRCTGYSRGG